MHMWWTDVRDQGHNSCCGDPSRRKQREIEENTNGHRSALSGKLF